MNKNNEQIRAKALGRKIANKTIGKDIISNDSIVYRKIHSLSSANEKQVEKLFNLFEGPYIVTNICNNVVTII